MAEEIAFENGHISNFEGLVTLTLDRVILHTVVHHSSTSTYMPNLIEIEETFGGKEGRKYVCMDIRSGFRGGVNLNMYVCISSLVEYGILSQKMAFDCRHSNTHEEYPLKERLYAT